MNGTPDTTHATASDAALQDILELMALRSRGRQTKTFAVWLAAPRSRPGRKT